jgi:hypothetical protein
MRFQEGQRHWRMPGAADCARVSFIAALAADSFVLAIHRGTGNFR